jgi:hypothetical protein
VAKEVGAVRQPAGKPLSVLDEVLGRHARYRRLWRAGLAGLFLLGICAVLWPGPSTRVSITAGVPGRALPWVAETGAVTGYIQPCSGLGAPMRTSTGARLFSAAAVVEALPGQWSVKPAGHGVSRMVLPNVVAAREHVSQNQRFRLDNLAPGRYVVLAHYAGGNVSTSLEVSVVPGQVAEVDLPNICK